MQYTHRQIRCVYRHQCGHKYNMGWLRWVGSSKLYVSFAKEPYKRDDILQKKRIIWRNLRIVATLVINAVFITHRHKYTWRMEYWWLITTYIVLIYYVITQQSFIAHHHRYGWKMRYLLLVITNTECYMQCLLRIIANSIYYSTSHIRLKYWVLHAVFFYYTSLPIHSYTSLIRVPRLIHTCDMTYSHVRHDSFTCVVWLIHVWDMTHSSREWLTFFTRVFEQALARDCEFGHQRRQWIRARHRCMSIWYCGTANMSKETYACHILYVPRTRGQWIRARYRRVSVRYCGTANMSKETYICPMSKETYICPMSKETYLCHELG